MILSDRSRWATGKHCPRMRFLEYSFQGTGIRPKRKEIPLVRGIHLHKIAEELLQGDRDRDGARTIINRAGDSYLADVAQGYLEDIDPDQAQWVMSEQAHFVKALGWLFYRMVRPFIIDNFNVVAVEQERDLIIGCTCGLSDRVGGRAEHEARDCTGICVMSRTDLELIRLDSGAACIMDLKVEAYPDHSQMQHSVQMALQCLSMERAIDVPVNTYYITSLEAGRREAPRNDSGGLKRQNSRLCYVYYKPGTPPMDKDEWSVAYTSKKGFSRVPVWEIARRQSELDPAEWWVMEVLSEQECSEIVHISPPMEKPAHLQESFLAQYAAEEYDYANLLWELESTGKNWADPEYMAQLDTRNRPSWDCHKYKRKCMFVPICYKHAGWEDPLGGEYTIREPHHIEERRRLEEQGVEFEPQIIDEEA